MSWSEVVAASLAPLAVGWSLRLAQKPSADGKHFRPAPTLRALYPGGVIMFGWGTAFCLTEIIQPTENAPKSLVPWFGLAIALYFLIMTLVTWPATAVLKDGGLSWRRMLRPRKFIRWSEIEDVGISSDGRLVVYLSRGQVELSQYNEGRHQLKDIIRKKLSARR